LNRFRLAVIENKKNNATIIAEISVIDFREEAKENRKKFVESDGEDDDSVGDEVTGSALR